MSLRDYIDVVDVSFPDNFLDQILEACGYMFKPLQFPNDPSNAVIKNVSVLSIKKDNGNPKTAEIDDMIFKQVSEIVSKYNKKVPFMKFTKDRGYHVIKIEEGGYHRLHIDNDKGITIIIKLHILNDGKLVMLDGKYDPNLKKHQACVFPSNFVFPWSFEETTSGSAYYIYTVLNE